MSWAVQVRTGTDPNWYGNQLRFDTEKAAEIYAVDLAMRWTSVVETRVVPTDDEPNREGAPS